MNISNTSQNSNGKIIKNIRAKIMRQSNNKSINPESSNTYSYPSQSPSKQGNIYSNRKI
jgi:hypothetical protein